MTKQNNANLGNLLGREFTVGDYHVTVSTARNDLRRNHVRYSSETTVSIVPPLPPSTLALAETAIAAQQPGRVGELFKPLVTADSNCAPSTNGATVIALKAFEGTLFGADAQGLEAALGGAVLTTLGAVAAGLAPTRA